MSSFYGFRRFNMLAPTEGELGTKSDELDIKCNITYCQICCFMQGEKCN